MNSYFSARRTLIDQHLDGIRLAASAPAVLTGPLSEAITSPGKRIRALLLLTVGEAFGGRCDRLLDAAAAFEMIHSSSLILDDLPAMDDAELRRGKPALHRSFGEDLAILSAVALLNHAYGLIAANHAAMNPRRWPLKVLIDRVVAAVGWDGTIGGEAVDLHSESARLDFETLEYIHSRKTGALFVAAASSGAILANAPESSVRSIEAYAKNLGLAFQITDDILDVTATAEAIGKDVGKDVDKLTFVKLAGVDGARQLSVELTATSIAAIQSLGGAASHLRELAEMVRDRVR